VAGVAVRGEAGGLVERQLEAPEVDEQAEVFDVGLGVLAVAVALARRAGEGAWKRASTDMQRING